MMHTDFTLFDETQHMLAWFADEPERMILETVGDMIERQVPGAKIHQFIVTEKPQWLTRARKEGEAEDEDKERVILVGTGTAFAVTITIAEPKGSFPVVQGVLTVAAYRMDTPEETSTRVWFDVDGTLEEFGSEGALATRVYEEGGTAEA